MATNRRVFMAYKKRSGCSKKQMDWIHAFHQQAVYSAFFIGYDYYYCADAEKIQVDFFL